MTIKGRSPTMRHVSRTHTVALNWVFDWINLGSKVQIKFVDTKKQLADLLTKESSSREEWNHVLRLFNIMNFSMFSCSHFSNFLSDPNGKQSAMSKRGQDATSSECSPMPKPKTSGSSEGETNQLGFAQPVDREGKSCSKFGFLETVQSGGSFALYLLKETCASSNSENGSSKYEVHEPSVHDKDLPFSAKRSWELQKHTQRSQWQH